MLVAVSIVSLFAIVAGYLAIIRSQGEPPPDNVTTVPFVATYLLAMAVLLAVSLIERAGIVRLRPALRGAAAGGLLPMGISSIGLPIVMVAGLAIAATVLALTARPSLKATLSAVVAAIVAVVVLGVGFDISWQTIVCPATGQSGGTTVGLFGNGKSYECNDGVLTIASSQAG